MSAPRARVLWTDGRLYVARSATTVLAAAAAAEPVPADGGWTVALDGGEVVRFTQKGCPRCGYQSLRAVKASKLVEVGDHWMTHDRTTQAAL